MRILSVVTCEQRHGHFHEVLKIMSISFHVESRSDSWGRLNEKASRARSPPLALSPACQSDIQETKVKTTQSGLQAEIERAVEI